MTDRIFPDTNRRPAGCGARSVSRPAGAGLCCLFLLLSHSAMSAPLGCAEMHGRRWCLSDETKEKPSLVTITADNNDPHPATIKGGYMPYQSVGQQVKAIPVDRLLPNYFAIRRSQFGIDFPKDHK